MLEWRMVLATAALFAMCSFPTMAAKEEVIGPGLGGIWQQSEDGRRYYVNSDQTRPCSEWKEIQDVRYYFDEEGYVKTGWIEYNGNKYWSNESGAMVSDVTLAIDGMEYVFDENGICKSSYKQPTVIPSEEEKSELHHTVDEMADRVLAQITNDQMTKTEKAKAIYSWVRGNIRYVSGTQKDEWVKAAYDGFRKKSGDCYTYYAVSLALLSRADIPSIEVTRLDGHHWWNLINCGEGWYHFDTTPRTGGGTFCLLTDKELMEFSNKHKTSRMPYGTHGFDTTLYPATPQ